MKKIYTKITKKNGEEKNVYICVDDATAKALEKVDEVTRRKYLQGEYELKMQELKEQKYNVSLEKSYEKGFDPTDEDMDLESNVLRMANISKVKDAIKTLTENQQWIVEQVFLYERTKVSIAQELGITESAVRNRIQKIFAKIKKVLK